MNIKGDSPLFRLVRRTVSLAELKEVLLSQIDRGFVKDMLDEIERNATWAESIAQESYEHDNGFSKIVLVGTLGDEYELRLHLWDGRPVPPSNIHNHTKDYVSILLSGSFVNQEFRQSDSGEEYFRYRVGARTGLGFYHLQFLGQSRLEQIGEQKLTSNMCHSSEFSVLHRIVLREPNPVLTIFCQGPRRQSNTDMFSRNFLTEGHRIAAPFSRTQLFSRLRQMRKLLGNADE